MDALEQAINDALDNGIAAQAMLEAISQAYRRREGERPPSDYRHRQILKQQADLLEHFAAQIQDFIS